MKFWNVVSGIAGILAVAVAIYVFVQERTDKSKKLAVELVSRSTLVNTDISTRGGDKIEVLYSGRKIPNYSILQFRITNSGGQPIRGDDYENALELKFSNISELLSVSPVASDPSDLPVTTNVAADSVVLPKVLLNPGDWFTVEVGIVPKPGTTPTAEALGRIAGVRRVDFKDSVAAPKEGTSSWFRGVTITQAVLVLTVMVIQLLMKRPWRS